MNVINIHIVVLKTQLITLIKLSVDVDSINTLKKQEMHKRKIKAESIKA
jgi:hypothetical protein